MKRSHRLPILIFGSVAAIAIAIACGDSKPPVSDNVLPPNPTERCTPGQTRSCNGFIGINDGVKSCFVGTQVCNPAGAWGTCSGNPGGQVEITSTRLRSGGLEPAGLGSSGSLSTLTHTDASSPDAGGCNPCDPGCKGWNECIAGTPPPAGGYAPANTELLYCDLDNPVQGHRSYAGAPTCQGGSACTTGTGDFCAHDMFCDPTTVPANRCKPNVPGQVNACATWDVQLSMGCYTPGVGWRLNVCNRGGTASPAGLPIGRINSVSGTQGTCPYPTNAAPDAFCTGVSVPALAPGECSSFVVNATSCPGLSMGGTCAQSPNNNVGFVINNSSWAGYDATECNSCNNYTAVDESDCDEPYTYCVSGPSDAGVDAAPATDGGGCGVFTFPLVVSDAAPTPGQIVAFNQAVPSGHVKKMLQQSNGCASGNTDYGHWCGHWPHKSGNTPVDPTAGQSACQADHRCIPEGAGSTEGCCEPFRNTDGGPGLAVHPAGQCIGGLPDLTAGVSCVLGGVDYFPICNRGTGSVAPGTEVGVVITNPNGMPQYTRQADGSAHPDPENPSPTLHLGCPQITDLATCTVRLDAGLAPGQCHTSTCGAVSGNKYIYVNSRMPDGAPPSVAECDLDPVPLAPSYTGPIAPGCSNNWTGIHTPPACTTTTVSTYMPVTTTYAYNSSCPIGYRGQWGYLGWTSTLPAGTAIAFRARTRTPLADGAAGAWTAWFNVGAAPVPDPQVCPMSSDGSPCPKNLFAIMGKPAATNEQLELEITVTPSSGTPQVFPTFPQWQLNYSCVPAE
jgi:hypothetical protein